MLQMLAFFLPDPKQKILSGLYLDTCHQITGTQSFRENFATKGFIDSSAFYDSETVHQAAEMIHYQIRRAFAEKSRGWIWCGCQQFRQLFLMPMMLMVNRRDGAQVRPFATAAEV
jgi:hypothetical protein